MTVCAMFVSMLFVLQDFLARLGYYEHFTKFYQAHPEIGDANFKCALDSVSL